MTEANTRPLPESVPAPEGKELALLCARLLDERRARDILVFDIRKVLPIADYFVLATGTSARHLKTTADFTVKRLRELGVRPVGTEGYEHQARWVLFDFGDVVVHLMVEEARIFYNLELLWGDCPQIPWKKEPTQGRA